MQTTGAALLAIKQRSMVSMQDWTLANSQPFKLAPRSG